MKRNPKLLLLSGLMFLFASSTFAQFDQIKKQMDDEFNAYERKVQMDFNRFVENNDKVFTEFLQNAWKEVDLLTGVEPPADPKPEEHPEIEPQDVEENVVDNIPYIEPQEENQEKDPPVNITPIMKKEEEEDFPVNKEFFDFYGTTVKFSYDKEFVTSIPGTISEQVFSDFWKQMSDANHYHFITQMLAYKTNMNLNDWGYYELLKKAAGKIAPSSENTANLIVWFAMAKSRYKVKVGYDANRVFLLLPSQSMMYGRPYYTIDNLHYFVLSDNITSIRTYDKDYPGSVLLMDFNVDSPVNIGKQLVSRKLNWKYTGQTHNFDIKYNKSAIDFYENYPQVNVKVYFDASVSPYTKESLMTQLYPLIKGKSETEAVNTLLNFVQTAFDYKTDPEQFGREKFFFPEELFHYPYCDCEDRSALFSYLVRKMVGLKVIGLAYPGHMSTAVRFTSDVQGDHLVYKGDKYVISDATYINAPVGMCMPQFVNTQAEVIEMQDNDYQREQENKIWMLAYNSGAHRGSTKKDIAFDDNGNVYITGYFKVAAKFGTYTLTSKDSTADMFVAKYNKDGKVLWAKSAGGDKNDEGNFILVDGAEIYVSGYFEERATFEGNEIKMDAEKLGVFVAKYDNQGNFKWANRSEIKEGERNLDFVIVSTFSKDGEHLASVLYNETEDFNNYGLHKTADGSFAITAGLPSNEVRFSSMWVNGRAMFNLNDRLSQETSALISMNYEKSVAGVFAFFKTVGISGSMVTGQMIQQAIDNYNPGFKKMAPDIYKNLGGIQSITNSGGIITISTRGKMPLTFADIIIQDQAKMKVTTYKGGNAQVSFLEGANVGKAVVQFDLNYVKLLKVSSDVLVDYDVDHTQKKLNIENDILD